MKEILDEKNQQYTSSSFDSILYILLNATNATILVINKNK